MNMALDQNTQLLSSRLAADIARENVRSRSAAICRSSTSSAPTARADNAATPRSAADTFDPYPSNNSTKTYGLQMQVPIFAGGGTHRRASRAAVSLDRCEGSASRSRPARPSAPRATRISA